MKKWKNGKVMKMDKWKSGKIKKLGNLEKLLFGKFGK